MNDQNFVAALLEEIALEGLDGITIEALWLRIDDRSSFPIKPIEDCTKVYLWNFIRRLANVEFYELPVPRSPLVIFHRLDHVDSAGNYYEPENIPPCPYPHKPVIYNGIKGSCSTFHERIDITSSVRKMSYSEVIANWGEKLVIVADQCTRKQVLSIPELNPLVELTDLQYCVLERIGRSRYSGEITQGKYGLQVITEDPKMLFYYRKFLYKHKLITKQVFHLKLGKHNCTGSLLHIPKFSSKVKSKQKSDVEKLFEYLKQQPGNFALYKTMLQHFDAKLDIKKILQKYPKVFQSKLVSYRTIYPKAPMYEWKMKSGVAEKSLRILKLMNPNENFDGEEEDEDDDENGLLDTSFRRLDRSMIRQCYSFVEQAGPRGLTQVSIGSLLAAPSLQARCLCKYLLKRNICGTAMIDLGRQRINHFYSKKFDSSKYMMKNVMMAEKSKLMEMVTPQDEDDGTNTGKTKNKRAAKGKQPVKKKLKVVEENGPSFFKNILKEPLPTSRPSQEDIDAIETKIVASTIKPTSDKNFPSLTGDPSTSKMNNLTVRILKRANLIMQAVNTHKVIHDPQKLQRMINEEENSEGSMYTVDRKTVQRLIEKLELDGHIRTIKVTLKGHGREKHMTFICHPSVDQDHSEIQSAIEQAKMKLPIITKDLMKNKNDKANQAAKYETLTYNQKAGRKYGFKPKFVRMKILHMYMHYLLYSYDGNPITDEDVLKSVVAEAKVDESFIKEMSTLYRTTIDWRMFISPLPFHEGYSKGWCLISDLLVRLPLTLFLAIVNVPYDIPNIMDYLNHPIRKYFLVKHLPHEIANQLTVNRKYIFSISDIVSRLGYIGLLQMGPHKLKEKDQVFVYLNKHAVLLDTTTSESGYNHISSSMKYEQMNYNFKTIKDVEQYWYDLCNFAMHTNLGCRTSMTGQPVVIENVTTKLQLLEAISPRQIEEAVELDMGYLPGDKLGAGGLDSDMFVHLKRNWYWTNEGKIDPSHPTVKNILDPPHMKGVQKKNVGKKATKACIPKKSSDKEKSKSKKNDNEPTSTSGVNNSENVSPVSNAEGAQVSKVDQKSKYKLKKRAKHRKITRIVKPKSTRFGRRPYYDQVDKEALRRMVKLRVDWMSAEDNLLLICKVASLYMTTNNKRHIAKNFFVIREILHTTYPEISKNKTSRACQRRMHYMMRNPSTSHSVYMCLEEIKQDPEINDKFSSSVEKLDALIKAKGEGPKGYQKEFDKIFTSLVYKLLGKLKTITNKDNISLDNISIPDTLEEFKKAYKTVVPKNLNMRYGTFNEVQNTVDILCSVVNTIIHSSLCCTTDKTSYSYQLFFIYQQYPDKLLRSVMTKCRTMSIVSCRKRHKKWRSAHTGCLPLSSSPYQLSITYVNILQTRYQYQIYSEAHNCLTSILDLEQPGSNIITDVELNVTNGGECASMVELYSAGFVEMGVTFPEHLIVLDPRLSETEESYNLIMKRFKEMLSVVSSSNKKLDKTETQTDEDEEEEDIQTCRKTSQTSETSSREKEPNFGEEFNLSNKSGVANTASRLALYMMRDEPSEYLDKGLQHAHDYFVLKPCKITVTLNKENVHGAIYDKVIKSTIEAEIKRLAIFPEAHTDSATIIDTLKQDHDEANLTKLITFLECKKELGATYNDIEQNVGGTKEIADILDSLVMRQYVLKTGCVNVRFVLNMFTKHWLVKSYYIPRSKRECLEDTSNVSFHVNLGEQDDEPVKKKTKLCDDDNTAKGSMDIDEEEPKTPPESEDKNDTNSVSPPEGRIFPKTISYQKKRKWVNLPRENRFQEMDFSSMEPVHISIRPWIRIDGTLNHRVLDRLLGSILGHCMTFPGTSLKSISERFTPALQPVHTFDLLDILVKIGCITMHTVRQLNKVTLCSKRSPIIIEDFSGFGDPSTQIVEPDSLAISRLGHFIGKTSYKRDYVDALTYAKIFDRL
ncbi:general transcription factor 3C polypeptide 1 isoform X2 [Cimex lectularius]|uniref:General transcription factor 3C polypeptide 1 n=1 Tax=Cimex lectularius TaxID=79782 RepID=A0A8I6RFW3_CIMLE|nr:general transcription factor 3C polypeptide 1 isoform X2 [Cimex lectularius]